MKLHSRKSLIHSLEIPEDLAYKDPIITVTGQHVILIENYRMLMSFTEQEISVKVQKGLLRIRGIRLYINYYTPEEMEIRGSIQTISLEADPS